MTCHNCRSECRRLGKRKNRQRYQCQQRRKVFTDARDNALDGMYTSVEAATKALEMLLAGCSVSSVERLTGIHHTTLWPAKNIEGLRHATRGEFQITTDGFAPYRKAIPDTLGDRCDFAMLIRVYRAATGDEYRYSPPEVSSTEVVPVLGRPDPERICTSIVERPNLSTRMGTRRFTRLTNTFSRKWENRWAAVSLWFGFYSLCRVHKSLRMTAAMAAGISDHIWSVRELVEAA